MWLSRVCGIVEVGYWMYWWFNYVDFYLLRFGVVR